MRRTAHLAAQRPFRSAVVSAGVLLLPMAWDAKSAADEAPAGPPPPGPGGRDPLPSLSPGDVSYGYTTDLAAVRAVVYRYAKEAGLPEHRAIDLVLAVSEVAANTVRHAKSPGSLKIWYDTREIVCQIQDEGTIRDPLAGRRKPSDDAMGGHGLWIVHQVCDEVEMQSDEAGTTIRLHMDLPRPRPSS
jgi:anti-sigma regulatory factor (Ser/Thr protein kinase)